MKRQSLSWLFLLLCLFTQRSAVAAADTFTLQNVLQEVMDNFPSVETALLQVNRARLSIGKAESQLGWQLSAQAGISRDVSLFGTASDIISAGGSINRLLDSGASLGIEAGLSRTDNTDNFPGVANPSIGTSLDLNYRQPLRKGADNPAYEQSLVQAKLEELEADARQYSLYDQLAQQVIDLYIGVLNTRIREDNVRQTIQRSKRLQKYLEDRAELGVSEERDLLQVDAQLKSQLAELKSLDVAWQTQRIQLNRLMGRPSDADLKLVKPEPDTDPSLDLASIRQQAEAWSADVKLVDTRIQRSDSLIKLARNEDEDLMDLVLFVGSRTQNGDTTAGSSSEAELVGGVRLEYQQSLDKRASETDVQQAMIDKDAALLDKQQLLEDIEYNAATLVAEISTGNAALKAFEASVNSEQAKLDEATERYRTGRSDTEQLINFEAQLSGAELARELQKTELLRDKYALDLLQGTLWQGVRLPTSNE